MRILFIFLFFPFSGQSQDSLQIGPTLNISHFTNTGPFFMGSVSHYISGGKLILSGGNGILEPNYSIRNYTPDCDEKVTITMEYVPTTLGAGIAISRVPFVHPEWVNKYSAVANHASGKASINGAVGAAITNAVGNSYRLILTQYQYTQTATLTNLTTSETSTISNVDGGVTSFIGIAPLGGTYEISSYKVDRQSLKKANIICLGDSKTKGSSIAQRYPTLLDANNRVVEVWAGGGDRTVELIYSIPLIVAAQPDTVIICMGRNDLEGIPEIVWKSNYSNAIAQLKAANIKVVHLLPIPEVYLDQTILKNFIDSAFAGDIRIDPSVGWSNQTMLLSDNIHPNATGNQHIANTIINTISSVGVLPVKFNSFTVNCGSKTELKWETESEFNVKHFIVEKSSAGYDWYKLATIPAGQKSYYFQGNGNGYYRIVGVDYDGNKTFSKVIVGKCNVTKSDFLVFPTITPGNVQVNYYASQKEKLSIKIISVSGVLLKSTHQEVSFGDNNFNIDLTNIPAGMYIIDVNGQVQKIFKK